MARIRVIVAERSPEGASALAALVLANASFELCEIAQDCEGLLSAIERCSPELIAVDVGLMNERGVNILPLLRGLADERMFCVAGIVRRGAANAEQFSHSFGVPFFLYTPYSADDLYRVICAIAENPYFGLDRHTQMEQFLIDMGLPEHYAAFPMAVDGALLLRNGPPDLSPGVFISRIAERHGVPYERAEANLRNLVKEANRTANPLYRRVFGQPKRSPAVYPFLRTAAEYSRHALLFF